MPWLDNVNRDHRKCPCEKGSLGNRLVASMLPNVPDSTRVFKDLPYRCWNSSFLVLSRLFLVESGLSQIEDWAFGHTC